MLKVKPRIVDGVVVVDMNGRITCGDPQMLLRSTVRSLIDDSHDRFVLNLSGVSVIDSSGLGELISIKSQLAKQGGSVNLVGLTKRVKDLMVMTCLAVKFDIFDEESKAITALQHNRKVADTPEPVRAEV